MMKYNTQNYWVFGLRPSSGIPETKTQPFGNWIYDLRDTTENTSLSSLEDGSRSSFRDVVFSIFLEHRTMDKVQKPSNSEYLRTYRN
jgi:hypothetical protein